MTPRSVEGLAKSLIQKTNRVERRVRALENSSDLGHSSIEDNRSLEVHTTDGTPSASFGGQFDGSSGAFSLTDPKPPVPTAPVCVGGLTAVIHWDGHFADDFLTVAPMGFSHVAIHASQDLNFDPMDAATLRDTFTTARGGEKTIALAAGTWYVRLICWTIAGSYSAAGAAATVTVTAPADAQAISDALAQHDLEIAQMEADLATNDGLLTDARTRLGTAETELYETFPAQVTSDISTAKQEALDAAATDAQNKVAAAQTTLQANIDAAVASGQSIILGGNFESGDKDWPTNTTQHTRDSETARSGSKVMFLDPGTANKFPQSNYVTSGKGKTFYVEAYFRRIGTATGGSHNVGFVVQSNTSANGFSTPTVGVVNASVLSETTWTKLSATYTIPDTVDAVRTRFAPWAGTSTNDYEVDDFTVLDVTAATDALAAAKLDAQNKADAALDAAKADATTKDNQVKLDAASDAQTKADAAKAAADAAIAALALNAGNMAPYGDLETITNLTYVVSVPGEARSGSRAFKTVVSATTAYSAQLPDIPVIPGNWYQIGYWIKATADLTGSAGMPNMWVTDDGTQHNSDWGPSYSAADRGPLTPGVWKRVQWLQQAPMVNSQGKPITKIRPRMYVWANSANAGTTVWMDDFTLIDVNAAKTAIDAAADAQERAEDAHTLAGTAEDNAQLAISSANGKNSIMRSLSGPSGEGKVIGDVWWQYADATWAKVIGEWSWNGIGAGGGWIPQKKGYQLFAEVDIGTLTVIGQSTLADVVALEVAAATASFQRADIKNLFVTETANLDDAVANSIVTKYFATRKLNANLVMIGESDNYIANGYGEKGDNSGWASGLIRETADKPATVTAAFKTTPGQGTTVTPTDTEFTVTPNTEYLVEIWLKADKPNSRLYVEIRSASGLSSTIRALDATTPFAGSSSRLVENHIVPTTWTKYTAVLKTGGNDTRLRASNFYFNHVNGTERTAVQMIAGLSFKPRIDGTLIADTIYGKTMIGARVATADTGSRIEMVGTGTNNRLFGVNSLGSTFFDMNPTSGLTMPIQETGATSLQLGAPLNEGNWNGTTGTLGGLPVLAVRQPGRAYQYSPRIFSYEDGMGWDIRGGNPQNGAYEARLQVTSFIYGAANGAEIQVADDISILQQSFSNRLLLSAAGGAELNATAGVYANGFRVDETDRAAVTFANSWSDFGTAYNLLKTGQSSRGTVTITGMIKPGTRTNGIQVATVAAAHRPDTDCYLPAVAYSSANNASAAMIVVKPTGAVLLYAGAISSLTYVVIGTTYFLRSAL